MEFGSYKAAFCVLPVRSSRKYTSVENVYEHFSLLKQQVCQMPIISRLQKVKVLALKQGCICHICLGQGQNFDVSRTTPCQKGGLEFLKLTKSKVKLGYIIVRSKA